MVTIQRFEGLAERLDAAGFLNMLAKATARSCADLKASDVHGSAGSAVVRLDCRVNSETGLPETFIAKAVVHGRDLHVFQVAWRSVPSANDVVWGERYLDGVSVKP